MEYGSVPFEKRIRENIKNYAMDNLYPVDSLREHLKSLSAMTGAELLLTDRHGEKVVSVGNFAGFLPDVVGKSRKEGAGLQQDDCASLCEDGRRGSRQRAACGRDAGCGSKDVLLSRRRGV